MIEYKSIIAIVNVNINFILFFYFRNPNFSQIILNGQTPVNAAKGKIIGGAQCNQLTLSNPAKQLAINTTTPTDRNVILPDGEASPKLKIFILFLFLFYYYKRFCFFESVLTNDTQFTNEYLIPPITGVTLCFRPESNINKFPAFCFIGIKLFFISLISKIPPL